MTLEQFESGVNRTRALLEHGSAQNHLVRMTARESRNCRDCGILIHLVPCKDGSLQPFDGDGQSHYTTCPKADEHRKRIGPMATRGFKPNTCADCGGVIIDRDWRARGGEARRCTCNDEAATPAPAPAFVAAHQDALFDMGPSQATRGGAAERYPD